MGNCFYDAKLTNINSSQIFLKKSPLIELLLKRLLFTKLIVYNTSSCVLLGSKWPIEISFYNFFNWLFAKTLKL